MSGGGIWSRGAGAIALCTALVVAVPALMSRAQDEEDVRAAVVKIVGTPRPGTGVVVAIERGVATVLTASHVLQGSTKFQVNFAASPGLLPTEVQASEIIGMEQDETHGLAAFRVRNVPGSVGVAHLESPVALAPRESLVYWGYPNMANQLRSFGGAYSGPEGTKLVMDRAVGDGASGGPIVRGNRVVGIVTAVDGQSTLAVLSDIALIALRGWGVQLSNVAPTPQPLAEPRVTPAAPTRSPSPASTSSRMQGFWRGIVFQPGFDQYAVEVQVLEGAGPFATVNYPSLGCAGEWTLRGSNFEKLLLVEQVSGGRCATTGQVGLTLLRDGVAEMEWRSPDGRQLATATLILQRR